MAGYDDKADRQIDGVAKFDVKPKEAVDHPAHYNHGKIECIDYIEDLGVGFNIGNAIKYLSRAEFKGKPLEDYAKAIWYIQREISLRQK